MSARTPPDHPVLTDLRNSMRDSARNVANSGFLPAAPPCKQEELKNILEDETGNQAFKLPPTGIAHILAHKTLEKDKLKEEDHSRDDFTVLTDREVKDAQAVVETKAPGCPNWSPETTDHGIPTVAFTGNEGTLRDCESPWDLCECIAHAMLGQYNILLCTTMELNLG